MFDPVMMAIAKMTGQMRKVKLVAQASWAPGCQRMYVAVLDYYQGEVKRKLGDVVVAEVVVEDGRAADSLATDYQCQ